MLTIALHYFKTHNEFQLMKEIKLLSATSWRNEKEKRQFKQQQLQMAISMLLFIKRYRNGEKRWNIQVFDTMNIHQVCNGILNTKREKKYLTELWKEKIRKKYRIFTIAHAQHTTSIWNVQKCDGFEQTNEITKREKQSKTRRKKIRNMMFVITLNG